MVAGVGVGEMRHLGRRQVLGGVAGLGAAQSRRARLPDARLTVGHQNSDGGVQYADLIFFDDDFNRLLGVDGRDEATVYLLVVGALPG